jgi:proline dehydrogenase
MEGSDTTASTLDLFRSVFDDYRQHVGVVLQAYLKRTRQDVEQMCDLKARVRLCKGAYKEPPTVAHQSMAVIRDRYVEYMKMLLSDGTYPGIATHDDLLISATKNYAAEQGIGLDRFEFQMLFGIRPDTQETIAREGYTMRVYVPYGRDWLPYFSRRLRERKENLWFVLRNFLRR